MGVCDLWGLLEVVHRLEAGFTGGLEIPGSWQSAKLGAYDMSKAEEGEEIGQTYKVPRQF